MNPRKRLVKEVRRKAILNAVVPVFAVKGFHGTTTKDLSRAAGVSEALLYRHFPSKEALYSAIGSHELSDRELNPKLGELLKEPPSTGRLVHCVQFLVEHLAKGQRDVLPRLMLQSLLSDGAFAQTVLKQFKSEYGEFFIASFNAAKEKGDLTKKAVVGDLQIWFMHHLALALRLFDLPANAMILYGQNRDRVIEETIVFILKGLGMRAKAIKKHYRQDRLSGKRTGP